METRKAGTVYVKIATACLKRKENLEQSDSLPSWEVSILESGDFDKIEGYVADHLHRGGIAKNITNLVKVIFNDFMVNAKETHELYLQHVLFGQTRPTNLNPVDLRGTETFTEMALKVLDVAHNDWMAQNAASFTTEAMADRQYLFLPIEMIGWKALQVDYWILFELVKDLNFFGDTSEPLNQLVAEHPLVIEKVVRDAYLLKSGEFFRKIVFDCYNASLRDYLREYVGNGRHSAVPVDVQLELRNDGRNMMATKVERQLKEVWR